MYVCYDYQIFALQSVGGISRYFVELASRLSHYSKDLKISVIAPLHINEHLGESSIHTIGKKISQFPGKHYFLPNINHAASSVILKRLQPDIFHETYFASRFQKTTAPRILTVYDMIHEQFPDRFSGPDQKIPAHKAAAVSRADHIIAISNNTRADLVNYLSVPEDKITVIPLASSFAHPPESAAIHVHEKPFLLYVGLRQGVKNFNALLNAYACSDILRKSFDLICIGGGEFTFDELQTLREKNLFGKVHQLPADDKNLALFYAGATLFIYPSIYEGFGLPLLEAMRSGCPVVCSNTSSMPEIAGEAAKYFNPHDVEEMQTIIEDTALSETDRNSLREKGFIREKLFSWESCVTKTVNLYSSIL